jgi:hypothetical protein
VGEERLRELRELGGTDGASRGWWTCGRLLLCVLTLRLVAGMKYDKRCTARNHGDGQAGDGLPVVLLVDCEWATLLLHTGISPIFRRTLGLGHQSGRSEKYLVASQQ